MQDKIQNRLTYAGLFSCASASMQTLIATLWLDRTDCLQLGYCQAVKIFPAMVALNGLLCNNRHDFVCTL